MKTLLRSAYGLGIVLATCALLTPGYNPIMSGIGGLFIGCGAGGWE